MSPLKLDSLVKKSHGGLPAVATAAAVITAVGVWASNQVVRKLGIKDPQIACIDEVAGVLITFEAKRIPNIAWSPTATAPRTWCQSRAPQL